MARRAWGNEFRSKFRHQLPAEEACLFEEDRVEQVRRDLSDGGLGVLHKPLCLLGTQLGVLVHGLGPRGEVALNCVVVELVQSATHHLGVAAALDGRHGLGAKLGGEATSGRHDSAGLEHEGNVAHVDAAPVEAGGNETRLDERHLRQATWVRLLRRRFLLLGRGLLHFRLQRDLELSGYQGARLLGPGNEGLVLLHRYTVHGSADRIRCPVLQGWYLSGKEELGTGPQSGLAPRALSGDQLAEYLVSAHAVHASVKARQQGQLIQGLLSGEPQGVAPLLDGELELRRGLQLYLGVMRDRGQQRDRHHGTAVLDQSEERDRQGEGQPLLDFRMRQMAEGAVEAARLALGLPDVEEGQGGCRHERTKVPDGLHAYSTGSAQGGSDQVGAWEVCGDHVCCQYLELLLGLLELRPAGCSTPSGELRLQHMLIVLVGLVVGRIPVASFCTLQHSSRCCLVRCHHGVALGVTSSLGLGIGQGLQNRLSLLGGLECLPLLFGRVALLEGC